MVVPGRAAVSYGRGTSAVMVGRPGHVGTGIRFTVRARGCQDGADAHLPPLAPLHLQGAWGGGRGGVLRTPRAFQQESTLDPRQSAGRVRERELYIDNLLVRIHFIIVMIRWTGLAPGELKFPFPGSLTCTFLAKGVELFGTVPLNGGDLLGCFPQVKISANWAFAQNCLKVGICTRGKSFSRNSPYQHADVVGGWTA